MRSMILAAIGAAATMSGATAGPIDDLTWSKRVLLVFSSSDDPALAEQTALFDRIDAQDIRTRDLLVLHVPPNGTTRTLFGDAAAAYPAEALRRNRDIAAGQGFTTILVGKDGGTKWRERRPARPQEIFALIDSMPMRAREMRRNGPSG